MKPIAQFATAAALVLGLASAYAQDGVVVKRSAHGVQATLDKLAAIVGDKGFGIVARIDHAAAAAKVGETLRPTQVLVFGNPKVGTALMQSQQSVGLDLPIRVVAWEDEEGTVWVAYNEPGWLAGRYGIGDRGAVVKKMTGALANFTDAATR
jgi:uncharacterized protein (DUF302 family)